MRYYRYFCTDYCSKWPSEYQFSQSQPFQLLVPWGQDKLEDSVISGPGTLETSEDLVISAPGTLKTSEDPATSATDIYRWDNRGPSYFSLS